MYYVKRHSGRSVDDWHIVLETENKDKAVKKYDRLARDLRQGTVEIYNNADCIGRISAPRLRMKW